MKLNSAMSKFLTNKWVLNIIAFLALLNVIGYLVMGNMNAVIYFIIFAVLIRYFSKNMTIVLGVPLILVNLLAIRGNVLEGMESGSGATNGTTNGTTNGATNPVTKPSTQNDQEKINKMVNNNTASTNSVINNSAASTVSASPNNPAQDTGDKQGFEAGRRKNRGYDIDYATTIEDAYDELNNILGSDGIQRLTSDTQNLMKQQMQLAEAMKGMTPVIQGMAPMVNQLKEMMGTIGGDGKQGLGSIMDLAKKFTSQNAPAN